MNETAAETVCLIRARIADRIGANRFQTWFGDTTEFHLEDSRLCVLVGNDFIGSWIANNHADDVAQAAREVVGKDVRVDVRVRASPPGGQSPAGNGNGRGGTKAPGNAPAAPGPPPLRGTLDGFVVGPSNRLAYAAALQVARAPGRDFKLLVIHGGCGLGKTHLLQGICNEVRARHAGLGWRFISGEEFTNEYIWAVKTGKHELFRARFRTVDLLVIDDIHFLANKRATQDEFLHTFDAIDASGKAVVLSSDRHPRAIASLGEPLINRLISGMVVEVQQPDLATRCEILRQRARGMSVAIPDAVLDLVARHVTRNVRELEGALYKLAALASLTTEPMTTELARFVLDENIARNRRPPEAADIERLVADRFGVARALIHSRSRDRTVSLARAVTMFLIRRHTTMSYPEIGRLLGGKNHSTVLMATQRVDRLLERDARVSWKNSAGMHEARLRDLLSSLESEFANPG